MTSVSYGVGFDLTYFVDHVGVVKAFLDAGLLPRVITGTSAGGLVAALVCTRTDDELKLLLVPDLANKITACEESYSIWMTRVWKTGARFDSILYISVPVMVSAY
jgi:predicted acylesterase/phospholipase RssA